MTEKNRPDINFFRASAKPEGGVRFVDVGEADAGQRLDNFLFRKLKGVPKSHVYRIIRDGQVRVNKKRAAQTDRLETGDVVRIPPVATAQREETFIPDGSFEVVFEDASLLVINKPSGVAVHGGSGVSFGVIEQLRKTLKNTPFLELAHRLDRDTSGILVLAKKRSALKAVQEQLANSTVSRHYMALVTGDFPKNREHVKKSLLKYTAADGQRFVRADENGKYAHTVFTVLKRLGPYTLIDCDLKTGRTHQIRVHLASTGRLILGDEKYGNFDLNKALQKEDVPLKRLFLHHNSLTFDHPVSGKTMTFEAKMPSELTTFLNAQESRSR